MFRRLVPKSGRARRLALIAAALLLSAIAAIPASGLALAQPPPDDISLVNRDRQLVERKKEGDFVARPVFSRQVSVLYYAIRHPDTGDWITDTVYRGAQGGEKRYWLKVGNTRGSTRPWTEPGRVGPRTGHTFLLHGGRPPHRSEATTQAFSRPHSHLPAHQASGTG